MTAKNALRLSLLLIGVSVGTIGFTVYHAGAVYSGHWGMQAYESRNFPVAVRWLRISALLGDTPSMGLLGTMYSRGLGTAIDQAGGEEWLKKAADKDNLDAQSVLGIMYATGVGAPMDRIKGIYYLNKASLRGDLPARQVLNAIQPQ